MKTFIILGGLFLFFVVLMLMALSSDKAAPKPPETPDKGKLVLVYDENNPDPEEKWVLRLETP